MTMNSQAVFTTALCLLAAGVVSAQTGKANRSYFGKVLPDIKTEGACWINAPKGVSLEDLRGGPTLVCFTFLG